jgi:hypothetical protein
MSMQFGTHHGEMLWVKAYAISLSNSSSSTAVPRVIMCHYLSALHSAASNSTRAAVGACLALHSFESMFLYLVCLPFVSSAFGG